MTEKTIHIDDVEDSNFADLDFWKAVWEQSENWDRSYFCGKFGTVRGRELAGLFIEEHMRDVLAFLFSECSEEETKTLLSQSERRDFFKMTEYYEDGTNAYECPVCHIQ